MNKFNTLTEVICSFDDNVKEGIRFINNRDEERFITYRDLYKKAVCVLYNLQQSGLKAGDELLFQIKDENNEEYVYIFWACILGKFIPVPVSIAGNENTMKVFKVWNKLGSPKLISNEKHLENLCKFADSNGLNEIYKVINQNVILINEVLEERGEGEVKFSDPEDLAFIQFSSGSTGDPKGVMLTHKNLIANTEDIAGGIKMVNGDAMLNWMPLTHDMGLIGFHLTPIVKGVTQNQMPTSLFIRNPVLWIEKVNQHRATVLGSPNFGLKLFLDYLKDKEYNWDLSHVKTIFNGAEPISVDLTLEFMNRMSMYGLRNSSMQPCYGLAEACVAVAMPIQEEDWEYVYVRRDSLSINGKVVEIKEADKDNAGVKFAVEGTGVRRCKLRIVDNDDSPVGELVVGHIQISGENVTKGYYNNPEATSKVIKAGGWLNTGDLGFIKDGKIVVTGRQKDIIFANGCNYYPHDIEKVCEKLDGISVGKVVAAGTYDELRQKETLLIFVLFRKKVEDFIQISTSVKRIIRENIGIDAEYVIPIKSVPKTTSGKIQRYKLIEQYKDNQFNDLIHEIERLEKEQFKNRQIQNPKNKLEQDLVDICKEVFKLDVVGIDDNFIDFGGDSLLLTNIQSKIDEAYPGKIQVSDLYSYPTVSKLAAFMQELDGKSFKEENNGLIEFTIGGSEFCSLKELANSEELTVHNILLAIYAYHMSEISGQELIRVNAYNNADGRIYPIDVDFSEISFVEQLFKMVKDKLNNINMKSENAPEDTRCTSANRRENYIKALFVYGDTSFRSNKSLLDDYELVLIINEQGNQIDCLCEYNGENISNTKARSIIDGYGELIKSLTSQADVDKDS